MTHWEIFAGGLALAAGLWSYIKAAFAWVRGLFIVTVWLDQDAVRVLTSYLTAQGRRVSGTAVYAIDQYYVRPLGRTAAVATERLNRASAVYWLRGRPLWLKKAEKALVDHHIEFTLSAIRGTIAMERLVTDAASWAVDDDGSTAKMLRHHIHYHYGKTLGAELGARDGAAPGRTAGKTVDRWSAASGQRLLGWSPDDIGGSSAASDLSSIVMMPTVADLTREIRHWFGSREWYVDHGIPWRAGYLYEGPPGTGKTSHARALAVELDLPVHVFDLASMSNEDLRSTWSAMAATAPCMAVIEDIDRVFDGSTNTSPGNKLAASGGLTFDALLNAIDGIERHDGVLMIITTNHLDRVDPALYRKGRVDSVVHFGALDFERRVELATKIVDDPVTAMCLATEPGDAVASAFLRRCCAAALAARGVPPMSACR